MPHSSKWGIAFFKIGLSISLVQMECSWLTRILCLDLHGAFEQFLTINVSAILLSLLSSSIPRFYCCLAVLPSVRRGNLANRASRASLSGRFKFS
jgi:hypothetical protein